MASNEANCDVCGSEGANYVAIIEGARLHVCRNCSMLGKVVFSPQPVRERPWGGGSGSSGTHGSPSGGGAGIKQDFELVEDYALRIHRAREKMTISTAVLSELVSEKESFIDRIEKNQARPNDFLAHKLEKELGIKLLEPAGEEKKAAPSAPGYQHGGRTLGDIIEIEKKKKG